jgi:LPXTG-site transpeptidase (sortase) family protein
LGSATDFTDTVNLPYGGSITYTVTATVANTATGSLANIATVSPPGGVTENPADNSDTDTNDPASLTLTKTDGYTVVSPGTELTYTIVLTNNGAVDLTTLTLTDVLPGEVTYQSANPTPDAASIPPAGTSGGTLTWSNLSLATTASATFTVTVKVNADAVGPALLNTVSAEDADTGINEQAEDSDIVVKDKTKALLETTMLEFDPLTGDLIPSPVDATTPPLAAIGEVLTYQISLDVPAGANLTNLKALDVMDSGLAFVRCLSVDPGASGNLSTTLTGGFTDACNAPVNPTLLREPVGSSSAYDDARRVEFSLGNISNASLTDTEVLIITYQAIVLDIPANVDGVKDLNNAILWTWDGGSLGATADPVEIVEPDLDIDKSATPTTAPLQSIITFTLEIAHTAESRINAYDVVVTDILPVGLAYVENSAQVTGLAPTTIAYDAATTSLTLTWDVFPLGETASITFDTVFTGPSPVTNSANVAWTSLPIDPQPDGTAEQISDFNDYATERWYDPADAEGINSYGVSSEVTIRVPRQGLPETGFAPNRVTLLPRQPAEKRYSGMGNAWLEIPALGQNLPITGVPITEEGWDLTWLSNQAGYLAGTTYPGQVGTSGITAHVTLADGTPGPFRNLHTLGWGSQVILHMNGYRYLYEVREQRTVLPRDLSVFAQDGYTWMTLLTCQGYVPWLDTYNYRLAVRAVLLSVEREPGLSPLDAGE